MSTIIFISLQQGKPRLSNKEALVECEEWTDRADGKWNLFQGALHVESMLVVCAVAMVDFMVCFRDLYIKGSVLVRLGYVVIIENQGCLFLVYIIPAVTLKATRLNELAQHSRLLWCQHASNQRGSPVTAVESGGQAGSPVLQTEAYIGKIVLVAIGLRAFPYQGCVSV